MITDRNGNELTPRGNCYATSEALYHLLGGKDAGWKPMVIAAHHMSDWGHKRDTHWFLEHESGLRLDPTAQQFRPSSHIPYERARGSGFMTVAPSRSARALMEAMLWQ